MKARLDQAIKITLKPSPLLLGLLVAISMLSCIATVMLSVPMIVKSLIILMVLLSALYYVLRDVLLLLPWSWQEVEVSHVGQLRLTNKRGQQWVPALDASTFIHPLMVILNVKKPMWRHRLFKRPLPAVIVFPALNHDQHRRLRVWLRWWKHDSSKVVS